MEIIIEPELSGKFITTQHAQKIHRRDISKTS